MKAIYIPVSGPLRVEELPGEDGNVLSALQRRVGGFVEAVMVEPDTTLWMNEDGKAEQLSVNVRSHALVAHLLRPGDFVVGDCVLTGTDLDDGETVDVDQRWVDLCHTYFLMD